MGLLIEYVPETDTITEVDAEVEVMDVSFERKFREMEQSISRSREELTQTIEEFNRKWEDRMERRLSKKW